MATSGSKRFEAVKDEFEELLGERLTQLGTTVRTARTLLEQVAPDGVEKGGQKKLTNKEYTLLADRLSELLETLR